MAKKETQMEIAKRLLDKMTRNLYYTIEAEVYGLTMCCSAYEIGGFEDLTERCTEELSDYEFREYGKLGKRAKVWLDFMVADESIKIALKNFSIKDYFFVATTNSAYQKGAEQALRKHGFKVRESWKNDVGQTLKAWTKIV